MHDHVHGTGHAEKQHDDPVGALEKAMENAWQDAKGHGGSAGTYVVERIELDCRNPIHTYTVIIVSQP
jgi:hypothetical protein